MKKLVMLGGIVLALNLFWGYAFAVSFRFDVRGDGTFDDPAEITIAESETLIVDIWLVDWDKTENVAGIDYYFTYTPAALQVTSIACTNLKAGGGQFDDEYNHTDHPEVGSCLLGVVEYSAGVHGPHVLLHRITLKCKDGSRDGFITASLGDDGILLDVNGDEYKDADNAQGIIHQGQGTVTSSTVSPYSTTTSTSSVLPSTSTSTSTFTVTTTTTSVRVCAIETLYGEDSEEVKRIRCLRDTLVRDFPEIQEGVNLYYRVSPAIVALIEEDEKFKEELKWFVDGVICVAGARLMVE